MRKMLWTLVLLIASLAALILLVRWLEPRMAFFPFRGETETPRTFDVAYEAVSVKTADGEVLRAWRIPAPGAHGQIIYFHGNGGNLSIWAPILAGLGRRGFAVFAFDYRGYGLSTGHPSERGLYRDVEAIVAHAAAGAERGAPLIYWGRSLGATMAAYAATVHRPDGIIVEAGFPDVRALVRSSPPLALLSVFSSYRFPTTEYLNRTRVPVLVMHGDRDSVIPFELGRTLFERVAGQKTFVTIAGGDHNDTVPPDRATYWAAVETFVATLAGSPGR
jgi:fermentation-respiration switch protein FrsA (DUF1100 family)